MSNKTKDQIIEKIKQEIPFIDVKPFSHNIISLELRLLEEKYGEKEVYNLINSNSKIIINMKLSFLIYFYII